MRNYKSIFIAGISLILVSNIIALLFAITGTTKAETVYSVDNASTSIHTKKPEGVPALSEDEMYAIISSTMSQYYAEDKKSVTEYPSLTEFDAETYQVNRSYNIPKEFYYDILPENMHCLIEGICNLEATQEISSMFLIAIAATEVGWDADFAGSNNWFNWTPDAKKYQNFSSTEECIAYTGERFEKCYFNPEWHAIYGDIVDNYFTINEINSKYAINDDGTVNTYWGEVVGEIIESFHREYADWVINNDT